METATTVIIPSSIKYELWARLEEMGARDPQHDFNGLYKKLQAGKPFIATGPERAELIHHCEVMIAIAEVDYDGEDRQFNKEARGAKILRSQL